MWAFWASVAAVIGTLLHVATSLADLKRDHPKELETWDTEAKLMDERSWLRHPFRKLSDYRQLLSMRSPEESWVIKKEWSTLVGWILLTIAAIFYLNDQIVTNFF